MFGTRYIKFQPSKYVLRCANERSIQEGDVPRKETACELEAQARRQILRNVEEAIYERRNASIEQERRVKGKLIV